MTEALTEVRTELPFHKTSVKACFAVGDCGYVFKPVAMGVAVGTICGRRLRGRYCWRIKGWLMQLRGWNL